MNCDWSPLRHELKLWRREDRPLPLWWRDDDAVAPTPALTQLLTLSEDIALPIHLAVIPEPATQALVDTLKDAPNAVALVHGWAHRNNAPEGAKKAEFGHPRTDATAQAGAGLDRLRDLFGAQLIEMFVPPWNRVDDSVVQDLAGLGYCALSTYTPRAARSVAGLVQINTHIDPIHWRGGGGLADPETLIAGIVSTLQDRRAGLTDATEPLGMLTHHLVHDAAIWGFTTDCLRCLLDGGAEPLNLLTIKDDLP